MNSCGRVSRPLPDTPAPANKCGQFVERSNTHPGVPKFADIASLDDESIDLATAALAIAADEYPGLDLGFYLDKLEQIGIEARNAASGLSDPAQILLAVNSVLFAGYGFHGNTKNYYDPRNSYLNQVIERRTGIPITLSIVYMTVADRAGLRLSGVGLPGHFVVKHGEVLVDPFNGGILLNAAACAKLVEATSGGRLELAPEHLSAVSNKQILTRMLANLLGIYSKGKDFARAVRVVDRLLTIHPNQSDYIRDRGLLLAADGLDREAIQFLELYTRLSPEAADAPDIKRSIKKIKARLSALN